MAPPPARKRKSPEPTLQFDHNDEPNTPNGSPVKKKLKITQTQKKILMDNLQLEITERARKLRAHYALQAQDLRARIERRINRIPVALRKRNMGELLEKHAEKAKALEGSPTSKKQPIPSKTARAKQAARQASAATTGTAAHTKGGPKRRSNMEVYDKENAGVYKTASPEISNPKRRNNANPTIGTSRTASQFVDARILSPKSSNSRTFPQSPLRVSPLKPSGQTKAGATNTVGGKSTKTKSGRNTGQSINQENSDLDVAPTNKGVKPKRSAGRPAGTTTKKSDAPSRPGTRQRNDRRLSTSTVASNASAGTTVVRPALGTTTGKKTTTSKKATTTKGSGTTSTARKTTAASNRKAQPIDQPAPGRRVLRNRG